MPKFIYSLRHRRLYEVRKQEKDSEGRSCKKIAKDNKAVWNLKFIQ